VLWLALRASPAEFRAGWFVESLVSAALIVLGPFAAPLDFAALPPTFYAAAAGIVLAYVVAAEATKRAFHRSVEP
jgi:Mg2+-importing ATPase